VNIGIVNIGSYIPPIQDCREKLERHGVDETFIAEKTGFVGTAIKDDSTKASDMCVKAFEALEAKHGALADKVDFICVCTQNGDCVLPQTSAFVHAKLNLSQNCAAFDISLGCSGYVYGLSVAKSFMELNGFTCGIVFTSDPYSEIVDANDKNTDLLFGDAATATLMGPDAVFDLGKAVFATQGAETGSLICERGEKLVMNGRKIFEFVLRYAPRNIERCLQLNGVDKDDVDVFLLHQASRYLLMNVARRLKVEPEKVPFVAGEYGNTVSSSVPLALEQFFEVEKNSTMVLSGFGVGLSIGTMLVRRR